MKRFLAKNKEEAIKYAKRVNEREGFKFFKISKIHLAKNQIPHQKRLKTWTDANK